MGLSRAKAERSWVVRDALRATGSRVYLAQQRSEIGPKIQKCFGLVKFT